MNRLTAVLILGLISLLSSPYAEGQVPAVTANKVVDRETLKVFVEGAKAQLESITDSNELLPFITSLGQDGDFKHGNLYLILSDPHGTAYFHAGDEYAQGISLLDIEDAHGDKVVQALLNAADTGGGFVEYYWDDPAQEGDEDTSKVAYATSYFDVIENSVTLIGGYYQSIVPIPEVIAADVVDRETLKAFVREVSESFLAGIQRIGLEHFLQLLHSDTFRQEGSPWRQGSVYFYCFTPEGYVVFHGIDLSLEGNTSNLDKEDVNGVKYLREIIKAASSGGGFVQYNFDDPLVIGDEDTGSPKIGYAEMVTFQGREYIIGAGFYTGAAATAVKGQSWGEIKSN